MKSRIIIVLAGIVALVLGVGLAILQSSPVSVDRSELQKQLKTATVLPVDFKHIPQINLLDQFGNEYNRQSMQGQWQLLFFGYTHCPDICPFTLTTLKGVDKQLLGTNIHDQYKTIFITVDPDRDTADHLRAYLGFFNTSFLGISGKEQEIHKLATGLGAIYQRIENSKDPVNYIMDHSASLFLINPNGKLTALFSAPHNVDSIVQDLTTLINSL